MRSFPSGKPVRKMGRIDDESVLDIPAFRRRNDGGDFESERLEPNSLLDGDDKLDIPTSLRKHPN